MLLWAIILAAGSAWAGPRAERDRSANRRERALRLEEVQAEPVVAEATREILREKRHEAMAMLEDLLADDDETLPLLDAAAIEPGPRQ
jgi:hypothetical protein